MRKEHIDKLWPDSISPGWTVEKSTVDEKFCSLGQRNDPSTGALPEIIDFHQKIGKASIEGRIRAIHERLRKGLEDIEGITFTTPEVPEMNGGVTIFNIEGQEFRQVFGQLYNDYGIACAPMDGIRFSPTIISPFSEVDRLVNAVKEIVA